jgi:hypothetical protein
MTEVDLFRFRHEPARAIVYNLIIRYRVARSYVKLLKDRLLKHEGESPRILKILHSEAIAARIEAWNSLQAARSILYNNTFR